jgi:hypothetical protein
MVSATNAIFEGARIDPEHPDHIVTACIESGARRLLLDSAALPPEFFDLSSGVLGALVHRLSLYGIRMAVVVKNLDTHSMSFQAFVREANSGQQFCFASTREVAVQWLSNEWNADGARGAVQSDYPSESCNLLPVRRPTRLEHGG